MDKGELTEALRDLDKKLSSSCDVVLIGGAAMILHYGASRVTRDVDALLLSGDVLGLRQAIKDVALDRNLPEDWMSDAVKGFVDILPRDFSDRLVPLGLQLERLRLYVLGRAEQTALKIVALREQDLEDLEILMSGLTGPDREVLLAVMRNLANTRPDWAQKIRDFLLEQGWEIA